MRDKVFSKKEFIASVTENVKTMYRKTLKEATQQEIYQAVSLAVKDVVMDEWMATQQVIEKDDPKILYYMSMEFLMGRALGNNLINLGAYGEVKEALEEIGLDLSVIEDQEPDPALGMADLAGWQHVLWILLLLWAMPHMDVESVTATVCSSSRLLMDFRSKYRITG